MITSSLSRNPYATVMISIAASSFVLLSACTPPASSRLGDALSVIESCRQPVHVFIAVDGTVSGKAFGLDEARLRAVRGEVRRVAACGGRGKVSVFSSSSASAVTLFEDGIDLVGATSQAKARRLDKATDAVVETIKTKYGSAVVALDQQGSDPVSQLKLAAEWFTQQPSTGRHRLVALTDGFQNQGLTTQEIVVDPAGCASRFQVPDLSHVDVVFSGIGVVDGPAPATSIVDGLKRFYETLCARSNAVSCQATTEIAGAVK